MRVVDVVIVAARPIYSFLHLLINQKSHFDIGSAKLSHNFSIATFWLFRYHRFLCARFQMIRKLYDIQPVSVIGWLFYAFVSVLKIPFISSICLPIYNPKWQTSQFSNKKPHRILWACLESNTFAPKEIFGQKCVYSR